MDKDNNVNIEIGGVSGGGDRKQNKTGQMFKFLISTTAPNPKKKKCE